MREGEAEQGLIEVSETAFESYKVLREYAEHEATLLNNRVTWLIVSNAFLFASVGFTVREIASVHNILLAAFVLLCAGAGFLLSSASKNSILAAVKAGESLDRAWVAVTDTQPEKIVPLPKCRKYLVAPLSGGGNSWAAKHGALAARKLPGLLQIMWFLLPCVLYVAYAIDVSIERTCTAPLEDDDFRKCVSEKLYQISVAVGRLSELDGLLQGE